MSAYHPPSEALIIFNKKVFETDDDQYLSSSLTNKLTPTGTIIAFAGSPIPDGYLICDGSNYLINDYPILATLLGTLYGTPSTGFFTLPNLVDRFIKGAVSSAGVSGGSNTTNFTVSNDNIDLTTIQARNPTLAEGNTNGYTYVAFSSINGISNWGFFNGIPSGTAGNRWFPRSTDSNKDGGNIIDAFRVDIGANPATAITESIVPSNYAMVYLIKT